VDSPARERSSDVRIRGPEANEIVRLREIAIAAKGHWGYDQERVDRWASESVTREGLLEKDVYVADVGGKAIAWAALVPRGDVYWLDDLWVDPEWMGGGVGTRLFEHAADSARERGGARIEWEAEPNAIGFYERVGGRYLRDSEPSEWGRVLPVMGVDL
jgi:GNAT superfamily N-acetyltransferase